LWFGLYDGIDSEEAFKNSHWGKTPPLQVLQQRFHPKGPKEFFIMQLFDSLTIIRAMDMQIQKPVCNSADLTCFEIVWEIKFLG
jgi:hypothetical protein